MATTVEAGDKLIVALDFPDAAPALALVDRLGDAILWYKIGLELWSVTGADLIHALRDRGKRVFLDLKFHDIPNTVAGAARVVGSLGVGIFNVHAAGGSEMMQAAKRGAQEGAAAAGRPVPQVFGVTMLTSLNERMVRVELAHMHGPEEMAVHYAALAEAAGLDGVVASPREIRHIREHCGDAFGVLTPGIRPAGADLQDQQRVATPARAIADGASYIVVGRPITRADDPAGAARRILDEIAGAL